MIAQEEVQSLGDGALQRNLGCPAEILLRIADTRPAMRDVLIAGPVVQVAFDLTDAGQGRKEAAQTVRFEILDEQVRELLDACLVVRIADIEDLSVADAVSVLDDPKQAVDPLRHVREAALLLPAVYEQQRRSLHEVENQLRDGARAADSRRVARVETRTDPVERTKQSGPQAIPLAVRPDHPVEQLLAGRIDPALFADRAEDQPRRLLVELRIVAHAIDFRRGRKDQALAVFRAVTYDAQIFLEVELEYAKRIARVLYRSGDSHERNDYVTLFDVIFDPFSMNGDIAFVKVKILVAFEALDGRVVEIHPVDLVLPLRQQPLAQIIADEPVRAEYQDSCLPLG